MKENYFFNLIVCRKTQWFVLNALFICLNFVSVAQTNVEFNYDASGNRETRTVTQLGNVTHPPGTVVPKLVNTPEIYLLGRQQVTISYHAAESALQIDFLLLDGQESLIEITGVQGNPIMKKTGRLSENKIDLSNYPTGSYLLTISIGEERKTWMIART